MASTHRGEAVRVSGLTHAYGSGRKQVVVLRGVELDVAAGEYLALTGPSGAGKTTLLSIIGGLEPSTSGTVTVGNHEVGRLRRDELASFRRKAVGFVFQHFGLLEALTAVENVQLALSLSGESATVQRERAMRLLGAVGLAERAAHLPKELSGGEKQRVAIARATANVPGLILADEPTGNLDSDAGNLVLELLEDLRSRHGCTLIVVTHNAAVAGRARVRFRLVDGMVKPA